MAIYTVAQATTQTLNGTANDNVNFTGRGNSLCVTNHDSAVDLYFKFGTGASAGADDNYVVKPNSAKTIDNVRMGEGNKISLNGNNNKYTVEIA